MITFDYIERCKRAVSGCEFTCKLVLDGGLFAMFPDGYKVDLTNYDFMRTSTLTKWLDVLYLMRKDKIAHDRGKIKTI